MRSVVVTGGSGALGRAITRAFLDAGDQVVVPWIVAKECDAVRAEFKSELDGGRLHLVEADISDAEGAASVARILGPVTVLVNGVGGFAGGTSVEETDLATWDHLYRINVRTAVAMTRATLPAMREQGRGLIVYVASQAVFDCPAGLAAYSASKAAVGVLTQTLQKEVGESGIRVNAIVPTTIDTPANREAMPDADFSQWSPPAKIAEVILWLASDAAKLVRGGLIPV